MFQLLPQIDGAPLVAADSPKKPWAASSSTKASGAFARQRATASGGKTSALLHVGNMMVKPAIADVDFKHQQMGT